MEWTKERETHGFPLVTLASITTYCWSNLFDYEANGRDANCLYRTRFSRCISLATLLLFAVTTPVIGWIALIITFPLSVLFVIYGYLVRYINIQ